MALPKVIPTRKEFSNASSLVKTPPSKDNKKDDEEFEIELDFDFNEIRESEEFNNSRIDDFYEDDEELDEDDTFDFADLNFDEDSEESDETTVANELLEEDLSEYEVDYEDMSFDEENDDDEELEEDFDYHEYDADEDFDEEEYSLPKMSKKDLDEEEYYEDEDDEEELEEKSSKTQKNNKSKKNEKESPLKGIFGNLSEKFANFKEQALSEMNEEATHDEDDENSIDEDDNDGNGKLKSKAKSKKSSLKKNLIVLFILISIPVLIWLFSFPGLGRINLPDGGSARLTSLTLEDDELIAVIENTGSTIAHVAAELNMYATTFSMNPTSLMRARSVVNCMTDAVVIPIGSEVEVSCFIGEFSGISPRPAGHLVSTSS